MPTQYDSQRTCTWCACSFIELTDTGEVCFACKHPASSREESQAFFAERHRTSGRLHEQNAARAKATNRHGM
jgi:hypothetical protein